MINLRIPVAILLALFFTLATIEFSPVWSVDDYSKGWPIGWYKPSEFGWIPIIGPFLSFSLASFSILYFLVDFMVFLGLTLLIALVVAKKHEA